VAEKFMSMKHSNETIENRTRVFPTCSSVPQPTVLERAPRVSEILMLFCSIFALIDLDINNILSRIYILLNYPF
jgi:hypothetical protein